jgi:hypothetical protein
LTDHPLVIFSPGIGEEEIANVFWEGYRLCSTWAGVVSELTAHMKGDPTIGIVPCAPLQLAAGEAPASA